MERLKQLFFVACVLAVSHYEALADVRDYTSMSLDELMTVPVYSVSKKTQPLTQAPAAVTVITAEDIRRSAARSVPEVLRMVPGLIVAQINRSNWSIGSRGFQGRFANKLLVMIDGRTVYNPVFQGVYWNMEDLLLQDIERIEVIRGPGGTLWGANAVNGVINILTKKSKDTQGALVYGSGGSAEQTNTGARYGTTIGETGFVRVYGKYINLDDTNSVSGGKAFDRTEASRAGFRADWDEGETKSTVQGDFYYGVENNRYFVPFFGATGGENRLYDHYSEYSGGNILGRVERMLAPESQVKGQFYYSRVARDDGQGDATYDSYDVELQHEYEVSHRNDLVWGGGARVIQDGIKNNRFIQFDPKNESQLLYNFFVQDEHQLIPDTLRLSGGIKIEHNDFSGLEAQPSVRMVWTPTETQSLWASYSRAVRTANRLTRDIRANIAAVPVADGSLAELQLNGSDIADSEYLNAFEAGYRVSPHPKLEFDVSTFVFRYSSLSTLDPGTPFFETSVEAPHLVTPLSYANNADAVATGVELGVTAEPWSWWKINAAYWHYAADYDFALGSPDLLNMNRVDGDPHNQFFVRSLLLLPGDVDMDAMLRYVDAVGIEKVPSYFELDTRVAWSVSENIEVAFIGRNLLNSDHQESSESIGVPISTRVDRSFVGQLTWQFR